MVRIIVVAETASGGDIMPPKRNPIANVKPRNKSSGNKCKYTCGNDYNRKCKTRDYSPPFPKFFP
jgi:hypothetical protein